MIAIEGAGWVAPKPVNIPIEPREWREMLAHAKKRCQHRGYAAGSTSWKRGLGQPLEVPSVGEVVDSSVAAIVIGTVGELAVQKWDRAWCRASTSGCTTEMVASTCSWGTSLCR